MVTNGFVTLRGVAPQEARMPQCGTNRGDDP
jgi:hypothetical protein